MHAVPRGLDLPHRHPGPRSGVAPGRPAPPGASPPPLDVSERCLRELRSAPELLDHYLRKCYTEEYYRVDLTTPSVRELLRVGPQAGPFYTLCAEIRRRGVPRPRTPWAGLYQELAERPAPAPTEGELRAFRDGASADALTAFVVETSCRRQDVLAQSPATLAVH